MLKTQKRLRGRPQQRPDEETRLLIVEAATNAFLAKGFGRTNMNAIAQAIGASKKTIYRLFDTKEALFMATIQKFSTMLHWPADRDGAIDAGLAEQDLRRFLRDLSRLVLSAEVIAWNRLVYAEAPHFPGMARAFYQAGPQHNITALADWLEIQRENGIFHLDDSAAAAEMLIGMVISEPLRVAMLGVAPLPTYADIDRRVEGAINVFLRGCLVQT